MATSVCRVCLVGNIRMLNVKNIRLLEMYEKLTNIKLDNETSGLPKTVCYVCHQQLWRCCLFSNMAQESNEILQDLLHNGDEVSLMLSLEIQHNLSMTSTQCWSLDAFLNTRSTPITINNEQLIVKEESETAEKNIESLSAVSCDTDDGTDDDSNNTVASFGIEADVKLNPQDNHSCSYCSKIFGSNYKLVNHLKLHTNERLHHCKTCNKTFLSKGNLNRHKKKHTTVNQFFCNKCDKSFALADFNKHMKIHTKAKPYSCDVCDKSFTEKFNLKRHRQIHSGNRPYRCTVCGKSFIENWQLTKHMLIHTCTELMFCNECCRTFNRKDELVKHLRLHTK